MVYQSPELWCKVILLIYQQSNIMLRVYDFLINIDIDQVSAPWGGVIGIFLFHFIVHLGQGAHTPPL